MEENEEEGLRILESGLRAEITELKSQIEENELVYGIPSKGMSSIYVPKDPDFYRKLRRLTLQRTLQVTDERALKVQADMMVKEIESCDQREYTDSSVPLLIHQYFLDRLQEMIAAKQAHLLRWKRYCVNSEIVESIYPDYKERLQHVMDEYLDSSARANRLSTTREGFLNNTEQGVEELTTDDMMIYFRWLICHLHSLKYFSQINRIIQWFPIAHRKELINIAEDSIEIDSDESLSPTIAINNPPLTFSEHAPLPPSMVAATFVASKPLKPTGFNLSLAAAGGGMVSDEMSLTLPLHTNDLSRLRAHLIVYCHTYAVDMDVVSVQSPADEMELFSCVNRTFKTHFNNQELMKTFKVYDSPEVTSDKWGIESYNKSILKPANWLLFIQLTPKINLSTIKALTKLRSDNQIDELLKAAARFINLSDGDRVQEALKQHALLVQDPPIAHSTSVIAHKQGTNVSDVFRKIYANNELYNTKHNGYTSSIDDAQDSFEFNQSMQNLGLNDNTDNKDDPSNVQGAYLSYLHLRHLKIRDLQRSCLSILNYFRSLERTLTINDQGLSLDGWVTDRSHQNHRSGASLPGHQGGGGNIGSHGYLFNTPRDFKMSESEFMHFAEVENHDDFYIHEDGRIHVRDQNGQWIIYDVTVSDFEALEKDLLLIATVFISKDKSLRNVSLLKRKKSKMEENQYNDLLIDEYGHLEVDRFGVLYDIWSNHTAFLESQKKVVDIYMEAYQNTFNRDERRRMAQTMVNVMHKKPRIDYEAHYFIRSYRLECAILRIQATIYRKILNEQIDRQRQYIKMIGDNIHDYGLPLPVLEKMLIAVNADESALRNIYFLEFHESLSIIAHITESIQWCFNEILSTCKPTQINQEIIVEKKMCEIILLELDSLTSLGVSYSPQIQRDLFSDFYIENPIMMTELADAFLKTIDSKNTKGDKRQRKKNLINEFSRLYELVTLRSRLLDATWESEVLAKIYQVQSHELGYDSFHLYLRPIQFEAAKKREGLDNVRPPLYISSIQDDDSAVDKFTPSSLSLAVNELDEINAGKFSFKGRPNVLEILETKGVENMMLVLKVQLSHKNALAAAVSLSNVCRPSVYVFRAMNPTTMKENTVDARSDKSTATTGAESNYSLQMIHPGLPTAIDANRTDSLYAKDTHPEAFFSIQLEKSPSRDRVMNQFAKKYVGTGRSGGADMEKTKRELISVFVTDFSNRIQQASLRSQIIAYYNSIITLLKLVPTVAHKFFQFGEVFEKKVLPDDNMSNQESDPRSLRKRARRVLSEDGTKFLNLWFIPHFTEIIFLYRNFDDDKATLNLRNLVRIIGYFHDILHFLVGFSRLQISSAKISTEMKAVNVVDTESSSQSLSSQYIFKIPNASIEGIEINKPQDYDGGVMSQLCTELIEIDQQINNLKDPTDIEQVIELLATRKDITFLKFEYCISHILLETFLSCENQDAYNAIKVNIKFPLEEFTNVQKPVTMMVKLDVPEPLEARDDRAMQLYPYRSLMNQYGPYLIMHDTWKNIQENIQLCLAGLSDVDRPTVHGEFVSLNLCLEDVLIDGDLPESKAGDKLPISEFDRINLLGRKFLKRDKRDVPSSAIPEERSTAMTDDSTKDKLSVITNPIECYNLMKKFIILSKRLDLLKYHWGARKLGLESIETPKDFKMFSKIYKNEKLFPLMKSICIQYRIREISLQGPLADTDLFVTPKGIPEIVVRQRQLGKMIETFEATFIGDLRKRIVKLTDQVIKERNREEGNLPLDLWKRPAMKEAISVKRPVVAEDFVLELMQTTDLTDDSVKNDKHLTFSKEHVNKCLQNLAISVLQMQRESFENYAMYYENQLKHQHQTLYNREREIDEMKQQLKQKQLTTMVDVQFQLADQAHSLLLEVNALRAKVAEMREDSLQQEQVVREEVRQEYNTMVQNLFSVAFEQKNQIDIYREYLHDATLKRIHEVRTEAAIEMNKVKERCGAKVMADDELAERNLKLSKELTALHQENIHIRQMMSRMKSVFNWHHTFIRCNFQKKIVSIEKSRDKYKNKVTAIQMDSEQKVQLIDKELSRLKDYLTSTEKDLSDLRKALDKEMKEKLDKKHAAERKAATDKQMGIVKQMHIDQLMSEITEKNVNIRTMSKVLNDSVKSHKTSVEKSSREVDVLKKNLREERKLKQNAFSKVDDLITQVYEFESAFSIVKGISPGGTVRQSDSVSCDLISRPHTGLSSSTRLNAKTICPDIKFISSAPINKPRPITYGDIMRRYPTPYDPDTFNLPLREPVGSHQLRRRIADQLLMNLEPDNHEQLTQTNSTI